MSENGSQLQHTVVKKLHKMLILVGGIVYPTVITSIDLARIYFGPLGYYVCLIRSTFGIFIIEYVATAI